MNLDKLEHILADPNLEDWQRDAFLAWQEWLRTARGTQLEPTDDYDVWLALAGRGWGKTRAGAAWIRDKALFMPKTRWAAIAATANDLRRTIFEGDSGLLAAIPDSCIEDYHKSYGELWLKNGSVILGFSSEAPERLRGPQFHGAWCDELASWVKMRETWDQLQMTIRLGDRPQVMVTTTPKPEPVVKELVLMAQGIRPRDFPEDEDLPKVVISKGSTEENAGNLAKSFMRNIMKYKDTDYGKQEIYAELLDLSTSAPLKRKWWKPWVNGRLPRPEMVWLSLDSAYKQGKDNDYTAMTAWGAHWVPYKVKERRLEGDFTVRTENGWIACLLSNWRKRLQYPDLVDQIDKDFRYWCKLMNVEVKLGEMDDSPVKILIEDRANGQSLIQDLRRKGYPVVAHNPEKTGTKPGPDGKRLRADRVSDLLKDGFIWAPGRWDNDTMVRTTDGFDKESEEVIEELNEFTEPKPDIHDDYVDSCTQLWEKWRAMGYLVRESEKRSSHFRKPRSEEEREDRATEPLQNRYA